MKLKVLNSGSDGNCYILTSDSNKHLILDCGVSIKTIKKGLEFDIENTVAALCTHTHNDHSKAIPNLQKMGIPVWQPYLDEEHRRLKTRIDEFIIESFDVFHNHVPCRAFLITIGAEKILYATDFEFISYDLRKQGITVMLVELNYLNEMVDKNNDHIVHLCRGHAEARTALELVNHNSRKLHTVLFCHMSRSGNLDRAKVEEMIPDYISPWINWYWCKAGETYQIDSIPF